MNIQRKKSTIGLSDYLAQRAIYMKVPLSGTFELSPVCNFTCKMCYVRKTQKEVKESIRGILSLEDWRRIAREAKEAGTLYILLTGGEPLLWPDFWTLYEELIDMGFLVTINTNGSLIDEDAIRRFRRWPPHKVNVTLYGASDETYRRLCGVEGVFTGVDNAIRGLLENGITVKINCSLTPENAGDLDWIAAYAKERKVKLTVATYMFPPVRREPSCLGHNARFTPEECARYLLRYLALDRGPEQYRQYLQDVVAGSVEPPGLEEGCVDPLDGAIRCRAGRASFWITWDGWMTPCGMMQEPKADINTAAFASVWQDIVELSAGLQLSGVCESCPNSKVCHSCAAMALAETGTASGIPKYLCEMALAMKNLAQQELDQLRKQM